MSKIEKINNLKKIKDIRPSQQEAMDAVKTLIRWAGDNPQREGLKETPSRVVRSYKDFFSGYDLDPREILSKKFKDTKVGIFLKEKAPKILDSIGDLYLAGSPVLGFFTGKKSGHYLNNQLLIKLLSDNNNFQVI